MSIERIFMTLLRKVAAAGAGLCPGRGRPAPASCLPVRSLAPGATGTDVRVRGYYKQDRCRLSNECDLRSVNGTTGAVVTTGNRPAHSLPHKRGGRRTEGPGNAIVARGAAV